MRKTVEELIKLSVERDEDLCGHPTYKLVARVKSFRWTVRALRYGRLLDFKKTFRDEEVLAALPDFPCQYQRQKIGFKLNAEELADRCEGLRHWFAELGRLVREGVSGDNRVLFELLRLDDVLDALAASGALLDDQKELPQPATPPKKKSPLDDIDRDIEERGNAISRRLRELRETRKSTTRSTSLDPKRTPMRRQKENEAPTPPRSKSMEPDEKRRGGSNHDEVSDFLQDLRRDLKNHRAAAASVPNEKSLHL